MYMMLVLRVDGCVVDGWVGWGWFRSVKDYACVVGLVCFGLLCFVYVQFYPYPQDCLDSK